MQIEIALKWFYLKIKNKKKMQAQNRRIDFLLTNIKSQMDYLNDYLKNCDEKDKKDLIVSLEKIYNVTLDELADFIEEMCKKREQVNGSLMY